MAQDNQSQKPNRKDFQHIVVIASNGSLVDQKEWEKTLGSAQGKDRKAALKEHGWQETKVFDAEAYEKARQEFRDMSKSTSNSRRKDIIQKAFDESSVPHHPRLESALRVLLPIVDDTNERKMMKALSNVLTSIEPVMKKVEPKQTTKQSDSDSTKAEAKPASSAQATA